MNHRRSTFFRLKPIAAALFFLIAIYFIPATQAAYKMYPAGQAPVVLPTKAATASATPKSTTTPKLVPTPVAANAPANGRSVVSNIYFRSYDAYFTIYPDSHMDVTEKIVADVGNLTNRHGIFQITSERYRAQNGQMIDTPITLQSITNFAGESIPFQESRSNWDRTVSWQIGDASQLIHGANQYQIKYQVGNVIDTSNAQYDVWHFDVLGSFWQLETDHFSAYVDFPTNAQITNVAANTIKAGKKTSTPVNTVWVTPTRLLVQTAKTVGQNEGVTVVAEIARNTNGSSIFSTYQMPWTYTIVPLIGFNLPFVIFLLVFLLWYRFGRDAKTHRTIIAEYTPPENLSAMELDLLLRHGRWSNKIISVGIMNLAVKGFIQIHITKKMWGLSKTVLIESKLDAAKSAKITMAELALLQDLMSCRGMASPDGMVSKSDLQLSFHYKVSAIEERTRAVLESKNYIAKYSWDWSIVLYVMGIVFLVAAAVIASNVHLMLGISLGVCSLICFLFAPFMYQVTLSGASMIDRIDGFKLFMKKVEQYRQVFFEKEGDLLELLPYAMVFGFTKLWLAKLKNIVSPEQWQRFNTVILAGTGSINDVTASISSISSAISSSVSSSSGGSGGGSSGGGGW